MTKKLICPNCKEELEYVTEHTKEYHTYKWRIFVTYDEADTFDNDCYESETQFFECPRCEHHEGAIEDFIVEEEES